MNKILNKRGIILKKIYYGNPLMLCLFFKVRGTVSVPFKIICKIFGESQNE